MIETLALLSIIANAVAVTVIWMDRKDRARVATDCKMIAKDAESRLTKRGIELTEALTKFAAINNDLQSQTEKLRASVGEMTNRITAIQTQVQTPARGFQR